MTELELSELLNEENKAILFKIPDLEDDIKNLFKIGDIVIPCGITHQENNSFIQYYKNKNLPKDTYIITCKVLNYDGDHLEYVSSGSGEFIIDKETFLECFETIQSYRQKRIELISEI